MCETSNLEDLSAKHLSFLIEAIDDKISAVKSVNAFSGMLISQDSISERLEVALRNQNSNRDSKIDALYQLRVCVMNAHGKVREREKSILQ